MGDIGDLGLPACYIGGMLCSLSLSAREATARAQLEQLQLEFLDAVRMKDRSLEENKHLHTKCQSQRSTIESLNDQLERFIYNIFNTVLASPHRRADSEVPGRCLGFHRTNHYADTCHCRYKTLEEKLFTEKETLKSQYETAMEERAKLSKVRSHPQELYKLPLAIPLAIGLHVLTH